MERFDVEQIKGYTITPNFHQRDKTITLKAKGLLSQMFSLPDDWDYTLKGLAYINLEGIDSIRSAIRELEKAGYIIRTRVRDEQGRLRGTSYKVFATPHLPESGSPTLENPTLDNPTQVKPVQAEPTQEKPTQLNKDKTNTQKTITDSLTIDSIPSDSSRPSVLDALEAKRKEEMVRDMNVYREIIKENISYDYLLEDLPYDHDRLEEMLELIVETVCSTKKYIRVAGTDYPAEVVRARMLKLDMEHIKFVFDCLKENTTKIRNIKQYLLTTLYNAPTTIGNYYSALVQHDLYGGSRD
ncbi:MAG: helix-turn-helix domain-containing protein [Oscillospiraceae bacterium]|nr:helix-turn-helix domain-containing protein [Oscillospiraceae bacterium]